MLSHSQILGIAQQFAMFVAFCYSKNADWCIHACRRNLALWLPSSSSLPPP